MESERKGERERGGVGEGGEGAEGRRELARERERERERGVGAFAKTTMSVNKLTTRIPFHIHRRKELSLPPHGPPHVLGGLQEIKLRSSFTFSTRRQEGIAAEHDKLG